MAVRPRILTAAAAAAGLIVTLSFMLVEDDRFAERSVAVHVAIETTAALIAGLAAYLVFGRFRHSGRLNDLLLVYALALLSFTSALLAFANLPAATLPSGELFATWATVATTFLSAAAFALAAWAPERKIRQYGRASIALVVACSITLAAIVGAVVALSYTLPVGVELGIIPEPSGKLRLVGDPFVLAAQLESTVLFLAAAIGFTLRAGRTGDELTRWFAVGAMLAAFARFNYLLFPFLYREWLSTGDLLRLGFYLALLLGAGREIRAYWKSQSEAAVLEERRRIARDLHDGLAQEVAFIATQARHLASAAGDSSTLRHVAAAAERALDESRRAIAALTRPVNESLDVALAQTVEEVADRVGARVRLDLDSGLHVSPESREVLLRVAREAVANAVRHGRANEIRVLLANGDGTLLRVTDDGVGFETGTPSETSGYGLTSMRERVKALGGEFRLMSRPGEGTEIEVVLR